jgi:CheY-like chemotaxis protein
MGETARILVVDDDPGIGQMLTRALGRHGYVVDATTSADEALEMVESAGYDAALVDLVMPERRFPGLPIGLMTGYSNSPLIPQFEKSGMAVFKKPLLIQDLVEFLQREIR